MLRVVRVGGSLLNWDRLPVVLNRWLVDHASARNVLVVGGGAWVDALREAAVRFAVDEETAHWLSVQAMQLTARLLHSLMPKDVCLVANLAELRSTIADSQHSQIVFDPLDFLWNVEHDLPGIRLERHWGVTSDSIAARVAVVVGADELVVLKSADPPLHTDVQQLAASGYVDQYFPVAAEDLTVRIENLRASIPDVAPHEAQSVTMHQDCVREKNARQRHQRISSTGE